MRRHLFILSAAFVCAIPGISGETESADPTSPMRDKLIQPGPEATVYRIAPFDVLIISVYGQEDLKSEQRVTDKGSVSMALLGEITIGGMTVSEAQKFIENEFIRQKYLVKPIVTISIEAFSPKVVTILGEVKNPGSINIPSGRNGLPIQIAIAQAGGFTGAAAKGDVKVTRGASSSGENEPVSEIVDVGAILDAAGEGKHRSAYQVLPDDIIFVPRRLF